MTDRKQMKVVTLSELEDGDLNQVQGGLSIKPSRLNDPARRARSAVQDTIAMGDTLVSVEAD